MYLYQSRIYDPYFNIATEEYFLKNFDTDFFCLYINDPCIIVGKHQNTMAEINVPFIYENGIKVVRRLSGGGTVFHDRGNLNYCFIQKGVEGYLVDFKKFAQPILDTLHSLGIKAMLKGKSDLVINDLKFSGNAEHVYRNKVLHHGTMLFNSELETLNEAIKADWSKFNDKAVRSNRSKVTNIISHLQRQITIDKFRTEITQTVMGSRNDIELYVLSKNDEEAINKLVYEKYGTQKWNFGYSPRYEFKRDVKVRSGILNITMQVNKGLIKEASIRFNQAGFENSDLFDNSLIDIPHHYLNVRKVLRPLFESQTNLPFTFTEIIGSIF